MTVAFVLSGGASLGAVQVGMLSALAEAGVEPDLLVGTSVGALNAAWVAGRGGVDGATELATIWRGLSRQDIFPSNLVVGLLGFLGRRDHLVRATGLRRLLSAHLAFDRLEDAPRPVHVVVSDLLSGREVLLSKGHAIDAILASAAIPGVFPPVQIGDEVYVDGGVANNTPISHALALGADTVWVLPTGHACDLQRAPRGALAIALHAITLLVHQRLATDIARYAGEADLRVVPALCPLDVSPADFSQTAGLIERAYAQTVEWLERTGAATMPTGDLIEFHTH